VSAPARSSGTAQAWLVGGGIAVVALLGILLVGGDDSGPPLSPESDDRLGTSALVVLAGELGAEVDTADTLPDLQAEGGPDVVLLFQDLLDETQADEIQSWVEGGGRLVVTDPLSRFVPPEVDRFDRTIELGSPASVDGRCDIGALDGIEVSGIDPHNGGVLYQAPVGAATCIDAPTSGAYVVATDEGSGTVVALGGAGILVNAALDEGQNAPVASALLAPEPGTRLLVLEPGFLGGTGGGDDSLVDLISPGVKRALVQLALAFAVYALWRAWRLGRPVQERQPVAVAGSELVAAVGNLLDRTHSPRPAADRLRADLWRFLSDRLGVPTGAPVDVMVAVAAERTGIDEARLRAALEPRPVEDDAALLELARTIDRIREEVLAHV
jgi:hypothetical protein